MAAELLFVGLDGADADLIDEWAAAGELPNLAALIESGSNNRLKTPPGFGDGVFWATLFTGCNAGRHGHYFPWHFNPYSYELDTFSWDDHYQRDPFWLFASKMGRRVAVMDVYSSPLTRGINGVQVQDWLTHDRTASPRSWPGPLIHTLHREFMVDPIGGSSEVKSRPEEEWLKLHSDLVARAHGKTRAAVGLARDQDWDLFAIGYSDAHDVGHQSWHWHDATAPNHPADLVERHGDPILAVYKALDESVGALIDAAQPKTIFVASGLGMGKMTSCNMAIDIALGHLSGMHGSRKDLRESRRNRPYFDVLHNLNSGAVRINLKGREANGMVDESDYDEICETIIEGVSGMTDADTGLPVVDSVTRIRESYHGPHLHRLPDLMVNWQIDRRVSRIYIPGMDTVEMTPIAFIESRSGDHFPVASMISNRHYASDAPIYTEQVAPTLGRTLGLNLPGTDMPALTPA